MPAYTNAHKFTSLFVGNFRSSKIHPGCTWLGRCNCLEFCPQTPRDAGQLRYLKRSIHSNILAGCAIQQEAVLHVLVCRTLPTFSCDI